MSYALPSEENIEAVVEFHPPAKQLPGEGSPGSHKLLKGSLFQRLLRGIRLRSYGLKAGRSMAAPARFCAQRGDAKHDHSGCRRRKDGDTGHDKPPFTHIRLDEITSESGVRIP